MVSGDEQKKFEEARDKIAAHTIQWLFANVILGLHGDIELSGLEAYEQHIFSCEQCRHAVLLVLPELETQLKIFEDMFKPL